ncbi:MAG: helix-turn-helix domain-containing protein [Pseudolabrys sp.]
MWQSWTTAETAHNRVDFWSDVVVRGVLDADMRTARRNAFQGHLASRTVAGARLVSFATATHSVSRNAMQARRGEGLFMVSLQCRGTSQIRQSGHELGLAPGGIAVIDSSTPFEIEFPHEVERRLVLMPRAAIEPWLPRISRQPVALPADRPCTYLARETIARLTDPAQNWREDECAAMLDALATLMRGAFHDNADPPGLAAIQRDIRSRLHRPDLTPAAIARAADLSVRSLHRLFAANGLTVARYLASERLARARKSIEADTASARSLIEIALACGFNDAAHFSRAYRVQFGESPRETRARVKTTAA